MKNPNKNRSDLKLSDFKSMRVLQVQILPPMWRKGVNQNRTECSASRSSSQANYCLVFEPMASPQLRLLEILQYEGVSPETSAIILALLRGCTNDNGLSKFILHSLENYFQEEENSLSIASAIFTGGCSCRSPWSPTTQSWFCFCSAIADALNDEASRWMSDFLLIGKGKSKLVRVEVELTPIIPSVAIGKRKHQGRSVPLHAPRVRTSENDDNEESLDKSSVAKMVRVAVGLDVRVYVQPTKTRACRRFAFAMDLSAACQVASVVSRVSKSCL
jgi:hypothetical protein